MIINKAGVMGVEPTGVTAFVCFTAAAAPSSPGFGSVLSWGMGAVGAVAATGIGWRRTSDQIESSSGQVHCSEPDHPRRIFQVSIPQII